MARCVQGRHVYFWRLVDISKPLSDVCFRGQSGHRDLRASCPLMIQSGHNDALRSLISCRGRLVPAVAALEGQQFSLGFGWLLSAD